MCTNISYTAVFPPTGFPPNLCPPELPFNPPFPVNLPRPVSQ